MFYSQFQDSELGWCEQMETPPLTQHCSQKGTVKNLWLRLYGSQTSKGVLLCPLAFKTMSLLLLNMISLTPETCGLLQPHQEGNIKACQHNLCNSLPGPLLNALGGCSRPDRTAHCKVHIYFPVVSLRVNSGVWREVSLDAARAR